MPRATPVDEVLADLAAHGQDHLEELQAFVRIPSVSAQPEHADDVRCAARWMADRLRQAGMESVALVETSGYPAVVADWLHAGDAPTVLVYGHYDVQPAAAGDGWSREPFGAEVADGRIWGRGTTDDKGQLMCHVLAAEAWIRRGGPPVNLRMVFEGEEEIGSAHFGQVIDQAAQRLQADLLVVSDSPMRSEDRPAITYALRGLVALQVDVSGPAHDLHSGTYGGAVRNPAEALARMLAACKDDAGRVLVPGFYDDVVEPTPGERAALADAGETDEDVLGAGGGVLHGEAGWSTAERIGLRPTFEVNGMWGGYRGDGTKTIVPQRAHAKISCRLVADQTPDDVAAKVETHLRNVAPDGLDVRIEVQSRGHAMRTDPDDPAVLAVRRALEETFGTDAVATPMGGSIPAVADMQRRLGARVALAGFGHRDENMHAPEESFRLQSFERGKEAAARILAAAAGLGR